MAFTTNLSGTAQVDDSIIALYDKAFITEVGQNDVVDPFVTVRKQINAKSIQFPRYGQLSLATTPLTETEDVTSEALGDSAIQLIPVEYGKVVTTTQLASLQTGGVVDLAAAQLVGQNLAATSNALAATALLASTNTLTVDGGSADSFTSGDVVTPSFLNKLYNKLSRKGNGAPTFGGLYVLMAHDDVINDLREGVDAGSWYDVSKYQNSQAIYNNEVGTFKGFRIIRNNYLAGVDQTGAGTVDVYPIVAFGSNALGKAISKVPGMVATGPFDKLARFANLGWHGVFKYGIIEQDNLWVGYVASSVGNNAA